MAEEEKAQFGYTLQRAGDSIVMTFIETETKRSVILLWSIEAAAILAANLQRIATMADGLDNELAALIASEGGED